VTNARVTLQIDIGFGDVIVPHAAEIEYPVLLEFAAPYSRETVVAEKLEAITVLGLLNSRMKDYFDLMLLSRLYEFDGTLLLRAVNATFKRRSTKIEALPVGLTSEFPSAPGKSAQWKAFLRRSRFEAEHTDVDEVIVAVRNFAGPLLFAAAGENKFEFLWKASGPWSKI